MLIRSDLVAISNVIDKTYITLNHQSDSYHFLTETICYAQFLFFSDKTLLLWNIVNTITFLYIWFFRRKVTLRSYLSKWYSFYQRSHCFFHFKQRATSNINSRRLWIRHVCKITLRYQNVINSWNLWHRNGILWRYCVYSRSLHNIWLGAYNRF